MTDLDNLESCALVRSVLAEAAQRAADDDFAKDEHEFYVRRVGFSVAHMLTWLTQLHMACEYLGNFDYSKKVDSSRASHAVYNVENYLIRLNSVYDRCLHIVNAVFHLGVSEDSVGHSVIVSNYKVQHRKEVGIHLKKIRKYLEVYAQERHTLVHRHSLLDKNLRTLEMLYLHSGEHVGWSAERIREHKSFRSVYLREFIAKKRVEFARINSELTVLVTDLFEVLAAEYERQRNDFRARGL